MKHTTTGPALAAYFDTLEDAWRKVNADTHVHRIAAGGTTLELQISGNALDDALFPALAHLAGKTHERCPSDIILSLWDGKESGTYPPPPPFVTDDYRRYGQRAVAHDGVRSLMHAPTTSQFFAYDRTKRQGFFWTENAGHLSIYERAAPVQTLFHWALDQSGWQIVHSAAVGTATGGVLLIGSTGAGKSTTALSCLTQEGLHLLSDDKCLVRLEPQPQAFALFSSAKIKGDMLERLPHFRPLLAGWDDSYKANKGLVFLHPSFAEQMLATFPIRALLLPAVTHGQVATIRPAAASDVFRQLGPSTVIWLPGAEATNYRFTAEMVRRLPCFRLELASDPGRNAEAIRTLLRALQDGDTLP